MLISELELISRIGTLRLQNFTSYKILRLTKFVYKNIN